MEYSKLGNSELKVSHICMGCMGFGDATKGEHSWTIDREHTKSIIRDGIRKGINFYDTAHSYQNGTSEQYLGSSIKDFIKRDEIVIATKFKPRTQYEIENHISGKQHICNMIDSSLKNLGMEYVDLYIYHVWDENTPMYEILEGLNTVVKSGKARYLGISNCSVEQFISINKMADEENYERFISYQGCYNLLDYVAEDEMFSFCKNNGIAFTSYSPLARGILSKSINEIKTKRQNEDHYTKLAYMNMSTREHLVLEKVYKLAEKRKISMSEVALAWLENKEIIPIVGITKSEQIDQAVKSNYIILSKEEKTYLERIQEKETNGI